VASFLSTWTVFTLPPMTQRPGTHFDEFLIILLLNTHFVFYSIRIRGRILKVLNFKLLKVKMDFEINVITTK